MQINISSQSVYNHDRNSFKLVKVQLTLATDGDVREAIPESTSIDYPTLFAVGLDSIR